MSQTSRAMRLLCVVGLFVGAVLSPSASAAPSHGGDERGRDIQRFEQAGSEFRGTIARLARQEYGRKKAEVEASFDAKLTLGEGEARRARDGAIGALEKFIAEHEEDKGHLPDVLLRLAALYYERDHDAWLAASEEARKHGGSGPEPDYGASIRIYQEMILQSGPPAPTRGIAARFWSGRREAAVDEASGHLRRRRAAHARYAWGGAVH